MKMKTLIVVLVLLVVMGCQVSDGVSQQKTNNNDIKLVVLFVNEGCTVYRFYDAYHFHYYAVCKDGQVTTQSTQPAGKTNFPEEIQTVRLKGFAQ